MFSLTANEVGVGLGILGLVDKSKTWSELGHVGGVASSDTELTSDTHQAHELHLLIFVDGAVWHGKVECDVGSLVRECTGEHVGSRPRGRASKGNGEHGASFGSNGKQATKRNEKKAKD